VVEALLAAAVQEGGLHSSRRVSMRTNGVAAGYEGGTMFTKQKAAGHDSGLRARAGSTQSCLCWPSLQASRCRRRGVKHPRPLLRQAPFAQTLDIHVAVDPASEAPHARPAKLMLTLSFGI